MHFKKIKRHVYDSVPIGAYLVSFTPVYGNRCNSGEHDDCLEHGCLDNDDLYIAEIDAEIIQLTKDNYDAGLSYESIAKTEPLWEGDTHDLRPRLYASEKEAKEYVKEVLDRWTNPMPWECFVKVA